MTISPAGDGPAARAVLDQYHRAVAGHRRRVLLTRVIVGVLVVWTLACVVVVPGLVASTGSGTPWLLLSVPVALGAILFVLRQRFLDGFGSRGEPPFPTAMLDLARQQDAAAARPTAFGAVPESMRVYNPEHW